MSLDKLKEMLSDNKEAIEIIDGVGATVNELTSKLNKLETDAKKSFQTRDELKSKLNLVKNTFGLDEIDEDNLTKILKSKGNESEVNNLKSLLEKSNQERQQIEDSYKSKLSNFALKSELQKTGLAQKSLNQDVYEILESIALKGATYSDDGSISYKNEDGSTKYHNGKPLTLADKVAELEQSEAYKPLFKAVGVGGTGANPNPNGNSGMQNNGDFIP